MDVDEKRAVARIDRGIVAQVQRAAGPVEKRAVGGGGARKEILGANRAPVRVARASERLESQAGAAAHAIDRLKVRGEARTSPPEKMSATRADQLLGGMRQRAAGERAVGTARARRCRVYPFPHC